MAIIFVARSAKVSDWASDVGLGKHVYKVGLTDGDPAETVAQGWAGEADWVLAGHQDGVAIDEAQALERIGRKEKFIDPAYYPRIKGALGLVRVNLANLQNHILVARVMAGEEERAPIKPKPADFAAYLISCAMR